MVGIVVRAAPATRTHRGAQRMRFARDSLQLASFFHQFDLDGSGLVEVEEFRRVLEAHQVG
jgi:hypothetical protein